jgi:hypothetical protein
MLGGVEADGEGGTKEEERRRGEGKKWAPSTAGELGRPRLGGRVKDGALWSLAYCVPAGELGPPRPWLVLETLKNT